jgi:hypothetical protein
MHGPGFHRSLLIRASSLVALGAQLVVIPPSISTASAHTLAPSTSSFDELMLKAEEQRAAGAHAESAALYGQAFRARPEAERADKIGEITIRNAMTDYDLAAASKPDLALLQAQAQLLDEFLTARRQQPVKRSKKPVVPQDLVDELARLQARIAELQAAEREAAEAAAREEVEAEPSSQPEPAPEPAGDRSTARADAAILGAGVASFVGGAALVASGAVFLSRTRESADDRLAALDAEPLYTDAQRQTYRASVEDWQQQWKSVSLGLLVGGAALAAGGIGLTSWGIVRMRKHRAGPGSRAALVPTLGRRQVGASIRVVF